MDGSQRFVKETKKRLGHNEKSLQSSTAKEMNVPERLRLKSSRVLARRKRENKSCARLGRQKVEIERAQKSLAALWRTLLVIFNRSCFYAKIKAFEKVEPLDAQKSYRTNIGSLA
ncbi:hypothetical protein QAD02_004718 [Eretmocerus hayati]|uniref:Uncharacterized protein n=1 Tax=Eretmocerus hayati TaxID=131215 RepID=A0ACC2NRE6_9HYME|nr:hypothetical protein QAD02_004718 [Eretmocerus hayati]